MITLENRLFKKKDYKTGEQMRQAIEDYKEDCYLRYNEDCEFRVTSQEDGILIIVGPSRGERDLVRTMEREEEEREEEEGDRER